MMSQDYEQSGPQPTDKQPPGGQAQPYVSTITATGGPSERISPNLDWLRQLDGGILRGIIILFGIIAMSCAAATHSPSEVCSINWGARSWFLFVSATAWINTLILSVCYFMNMNNVYKTMPPWPIVELVEDGLFTLFYFIGAITQVATTTCGPGVAGGAFGFFLIILYGIATYFSFRKFRQP